MQPETLCSAEKRHATRWLRCQGASVCLRNAINLPEKVFGGVARGVASHMPTNLMGVGGAVHRCIDIGLIACGVYSITHLANGQRIPPKV